MRRAGAVAVILTLLVLLTGCDGLRTKAPAQAQRYAPLPERSPEQAAYELLDALLLSPVTVALPPGFTAPAPRDGIGAFRPQTFEPASRALAGVIVSVKGPDALDQVALAVWATAVEAEADFAAVLAYDAPPLTGRFTPAGLGVPSTCVTAAPSDTGYGGWSNCQALVGSVRLYGITRSRDD